MFLNISILNLNFFSSRRQTDKGTRPRPGTWQSSRTRSEFKNVTDRLMDGLTKWSRVSKRYTYQPTDWPTDQPTDQLINRLTNRPTNQPTDGRTKQGVETCARNWKQTGSEPKSMRCTQKRKCTEEKETSIYHFFQSMEVVFIGSHCRHQYRHCLRIVVIVLRHSLL